jgi:cytochrome c peroxidase
MRFAPESEHGANRGLHIARGEMERVKQEFPWISYGDLWTLGGVAAVQEMGGPRVPWRPGRIDGVAAQATPDGRLPDGAKGADHIRAIFGRMGFNDQEIVALVGAHALGRCHRDRSGFEGPWTFSPTTLTNDFFRLLFDETWVWKKWDGPTQLEDKKTRSLMMLPYVFLPRFFDFSGAHFGCSLVRIMFSSRTSPSRNTPRLMPTMSNSSSKSMFFPLFA